MDVEKSSNHKSLILLSFFEIDLSFHTVANSRVIWLYWNIRWQSSKVWQLFFAQLSNKIMNIYYYLAHLIYITIFVYISRYVLIGTVVIIFHATFLNFYRPKLLFKKKLGRNPRSDRDLCKKGNKSPKKK